MKDELFSDDLVWRGLEAAEPYIPTTGTRTAYRNVTWGKITENYVAAISVI
jgi:hypothetical protein